MVLHVTLPPNVEYFCPQAGPRLWNSLPITLRQISGYGQFRRYLKNHLFWDLRNHRAAWRMILCAIYIFLLTYLLTYLLTSD